MGKSAALITYFDGFIGNNRVTPLVAINDVFLVAIIDGKWPKLSDLDHLGLFF